MARRPSTACRYLTRLSRTETRQEVAASRRTAPTISPEHATSNSTPDRLEHKTFEIVTGTESVTGWIDTSDNDSASKCEGLLRLAQCADVEGLCPCRCLRRVHPNRRQGSDNRARQPAEISTLQPTLCRPPRRIPYCGVTPCGLQAIGDIWYQPASRNVKPETS
jgi:hypothetical protein